jgi:hypothetical protein
VVCALFTIDVTSIDGDYVPPWLPLEQLAANQNLCHAALSSSATGGHATETAAFQWHDASLAMMAYVVSCRHTLCLPGVAFSMQQHRLTAA